MITVKDLPITDAKLITLKRHGDHRGAFTEMFRETWADEYLNYRKFIFDYCSFSVNKGTIRGLHAQTHVAPQAKLITVLNGSIQDVMVDARKDSPTYGEHISVNIRSDQPQLLYIPPGFYHGFCTLEPNTYVWYKVDVYHDASAEIGVGYNDPALGIKWQLDREPVISQRDQNHPAWADAYKF